jgi:hypothetical protein
MVVKIDPGIDAQARWNLSLAHGGGNRGLIEPRRTSPVYSLAELAHLIVRTSPALVRITQIR